MSQRMSSARSSALVTRGTLAQGIRRSLRQAGCGAEMVVRVEQLCCVPDVAPVAADGVAVDARARDEPGDEATGLVGRIAVVEVAADQRHMAAVVDVGGGRDQRR